METFCIDGYRIAARTKTQALMAAALLKKHNVKPDYVVQVKHADCGEIDDGKHPKDCYYCRVARDWRNAVNAA